MEDSDDDYGDLDFIGGATSNIETTWSETRFNNQEAVTPDSSSKIRKIDNDSRVSVITSPLCDATSPQQSPAPTPSSSDVRKRPSRSRRGKKNEEEKLEESVDLEQEPITPDKEFPSNQENLTPPPSPSVVQSGGWSGGRRGGRGRGRGRGVRGAAATKKTLQALKRLEETPSTVVTAENPLQKLWKKKKGGKKKGSKTKDEEGIEISDDEEYQDDLEYVKIQWKTNIERVEVRQSDRMGDVLDRFVRKLELEAGDIYLVMKDESSVKKMEQVPREMSAENVHVATIFKARSRKEDSKTKEAPSIELKVQTKDRRASVNIKLSMVDKMSVLMEKYSQMKNVEMSTLKFYFDGEELDAEETCHSLELEGGECIDVHET